VLLLLLLLHVTALLCTLTGLVALPRVHCSQVVIVTACISRFMDGTIAALPPQPCRYGAAINKTGDEGRKYFFDRIRRFVQRLRRGVDPSLRGKQ
jgi:hypothetical protein